MAKKLRNESTAGVGTLLGVFLVAASLIVRRENPLSVILWLGLMAALFIRCAMRGNHDRILGFPGLCALWGGMAIPTRTMLGCTAESLSLLPWSLLLTGMISPLFCLSVWRKERKGKPWSKAVLCAFGLLLIFVFSLNAAQLANAAFDASEVTSLTAAVTEKQENHRVRAGTSRYIMAEVPGEADALRFNVSRQHYRASTVGDEVTVLRHEGFLGAPWWELAPIG